MAVYDQSVIDRARDADLPPGAIACRVRNGHIGTLEHWLHVHVGAYGADSYARCKATLRALYELEELVK